MSDTSRLSISLNDRGVNVDGAGVSGRQAQDCMHGTVPAVCAGTERDRGCLSTSGLCSRSTSSSSRSSDGNSSLLDEGGSALQLHQAYSLRATGVWSGQIQFLSGS